MKDFLAGIFLYIIYYPVLGFFSLIYHIMGINPFQMDDKCNSYWQPVEKDSQNHIIS